MVAWGKLVFFLLNGSHGRAGQLDMLPTSPRGRFPCSRVPRGGEAARPGRCLAGEGEEEPPLARSAASRPPCPAAGCRRRHEGAGARGSPASLLSPPLSCLPPSFPAAPGVPRTLPCHVKMEVRQDWLSAAPHEGFEQMRLKSRPKEPSPSLARAGPNFYSTVKQQDYSASVWLRRKDKLEHVSWLPAPAGGFLGGSACAGRAGWREDRAGPQVGPTGQAGTSRARRISPPADTAPKEEPPPGRLFVQTGFSLPIQQCSGGRTWPCRPELWSSSPPHLLWPQGKPFPAWMWCPRALNLRGVQEISLQDQFLQQLYMT